MWDPQTWELQNYLPLGILLDLSASGTKQLLAAGLYDNSVRVWSISEGQEIQILQWHRGNVYSVAWSHDGRRLASASEDGTVAVWETTNWRMVSWFRTDESVIGQGPAGAVAWSPDGKLLAAAAAQGTVGVWEADTAELLATLRGHTAPVRAIDWSADGSKIASGGWDGMVLVWGLPAE